MKVIIGNGIDSIETELATQPEVTDFLQDTAVIFKQALKALAVAVPTTVEYKNHPATNTTTKTSEPPYRPRDDQSRRAEPEVCGKCGNKTLYTNVTAEKRKDGSLNPNVGKRYKSCKCGVWIPIDEFPRK